MRPILIVLVMLTNILLMGLIIFGFLEVFDVLNSPECGPMPFN